MKKEKQENVRDSIGPQFPFSDELENTKLSINRNGYNGVPVAGLNTESLLEIQTNSDKFMSFVNSHKDCDVVNVLKKFGKLPRDFAGKNILIELLSSKSKNVRLMAVENLAKLTDCKILPHFVNLLNKIGEISEIRKEAASAIGRMRSEIAIPVLEELLYDYDPNVILQAIRGLLVFKSDEKIREKLLSLVSHENETVQNMIKAEFGISENEAEDFIDHVTSPDFMQNVVVHGDVREIIQHIPNGSVHLTFTSPPYYNARDYSIYKSYKSYLEFLKEIFSETYRITKEGRFFILNTSPIIIPRIGRSYASKRYPIPYDLHSILEDIGWEFIDDIVWKKPEASAKNRVSGFNQNRKPLAYKPNCVTECVMVYRKKSNKLIDWNIKQYDESIIEQSLVKENILTSNVWEIDPVSDKVHSATFPYMLCDYIIKYYSFVGDLIFDPFGGSGTLGKASLDNERKFFITEINKEYIDRIEEKILVDSQNGTPFRKLNLNKFTKQAKKVKQHQRG